MALYKFLVVLSNKNICHSEDPNLGEIETPQEEMPIRVFTRGDSNHLFIAKN